MAEHDTKLPGRRQFVATLSAVAVTAACSQDDGGAAADAGSAEDDLAALPVDSQVFAHGVASGDPLADRVILWTRVSGASDTVRVRYRVATDPELADEVVSGSAEASADADFTVKIDAEGLEPGTTYYYAFATDEARSPTGRTKTLPEAGVARVRLAYTSCANYNNGYFHAYRNIAARADLDVWVHLGDYIYEYADGVYGDPSLGRVNEPAYETVTLDDYRTRYAQYRREPELQELHRQLPCIAIWDDHEFANNAHIQGAENHDPATEGAWDERKHVAAQAFLEWLPIRAAATSTVPKIYRSFAFGDLFDLIMLDTRMIGRDQQASYDVDGDRGDPAVWNDPARQLLGSEQEEWFKDALSASNERGAAYRLIGNQIMFSPTDDPTAPGTPLFSDFWDGYKPARQRIADHIKGEGIHDVVFLTGDIHTSWAMEVADDPFTPIAEGGSYDKATGEGAYAVEVVGPSVTSLGLEDDPTLASVAPVLLRGANPHVKFSEVTRKGYVLVDVTPDALSAEWYYIKDHKDPSDAGAAEELAKAFVVTRGTSHLVETSSATEPGEAAAPAP
jgi:alkaline phosphatase D